MQEKADILPLFTRPISRRQMLFATAATIFLTSCAEQTQAHSLSTIDFARKAPEWYKSGESITLHLNPDDHIIVTMRPNPEVDVVTVTNGTARSCALLSPYTADVAPENITLVMPNASSAWQKTANAIQKNQPLTATSMQGTVGLATIPLANEQFPLGYVFLCQTLQ